MKPAKTGRFFNRENYLIIVFAVVSFLAAFNPIFKLDLLITTLIQSIHSPLFQNLMWSVSAIGNQPFMVILVGLIGTLLFIFKLRTEAVIGTLAAALSALSGSLLKIIVDRPRPASDLVHVSTWLSDKSYPSNHVLVFTVFFGFLLYLLFKKTIHTAQDYLISIILILLIASIGISRIYLGVHWASDVFGGYLLGIIWLIFTIRLYNLQHGKR